MSRIRCLPALFWGGRRPWNIEREVGWAERANGNAAVSLYLGASFLLTHHSVQVRHWDNVSFPLHTI